MKASTTRGRLSDAHAPSRACPRPGLRPQPAKGGESPRPAPSAGNLATLRGRGGAPLAPQLQRDYGRFFRAELSAVRVHTGTEAEAATHVLRAEAFTVGNDIYFERGRFAPETTQGRELLAHELAHVLQQRARGPALQRRLKVNDAHPPFAPASDPAAGLTAAQRFAMMEGLIQALCDEFEVDGASGEVLTKSRTSIDPAVLASGAKPTGCCCLDVLVNEPDTWTIHVSQVVGPRNLGGRDIVLSPTNTPVEFGSFTAGGTLAFQGQVPAAGHEICGHAALIALKAHPPASDRTRTDVHDPTVRIENLISAEQGVPAADLRGLAASGAHRGESVDRITLRDYPFNGTDVAGLPPAERDKLRFAADYASVNDTFVDILGHSDNVGSSAAKLGVSQARADKARAELRSLGVTDTFVPPGFSSATARFTRVEGVSDTQPPPAPLNASAGNWRRVDLLMAGFPAGAQIPPPGTPTTVTPHAPNPNVPTLKASPNACVRHLVWGAYP